MKRNKLYWVIVIFLLLASSFQMAGANNNKLPTGKALLNLSSEKLMQSGTDCMNTDANTSLLCFTVVCNRYDYSSMNEYEKKQCAEACMRLWEIYFYKFYDYPKCFDYLSRALDIANENDFKMPEIFLGFGCMYTTIADETNNRELRQRSLDYYKQALSTATIINDGLQADMAATNMLSIASILNGIQSIKQEWNKYVSLKPTSNQLLRNYNILLHKAFSCIEKKDYKQSLDIFERQLNMLKGSKYKRLIYFTLVEKSKIYSKKADFIGAISTLQQAEAIAIERDMKDCKLEAFSLLADNYRQSGNMAQADKYRERSIQLKDTLTNYRQLASVNETEFRQQLKAMDKQMANIRHHHQQLQTISVMIFIVAIVVIAFLFIVFHKNKQLRRSNRSLYEKNVAVLKAEEDERRMRKKYEEQLQQVMQTATNQEQTEENILKYKNSTLTDNDKQALLSRIIHIIENNEEIFSPDFSVERLAQLAESKYKYVSQVIHETYDCNFNTFINDYRIKEACKRISDVERFGKLTIEAISNSVGFKSRSSFVTSFKRVTGLTPSEYQRQAQKR